MPATRLVQIKLPIKEHRALAKAARQAGRTLTGHIRLALTEQQDETQIDHQTVLKLFALFAEVADNLVMATDKPCDCGILMAEIRQQLGNLSRST